MQDRYLFKAKRKDDGEWVIGNRIDDGVTGQVFIHAVGNSVNESDKVGEEGCLQFVAFEVAPSTICQCTGLKDKNGKLIWENDIVNCMDAECCGYISWNESEAGFYFDILLEDGGFEEEHIYDYQDCMEVISNEFDNKELLESEDRDENNY
jgi:uncharacterized phage protein (TIGR01671 family)